MRLVSDTGWFRIHDLLEFENIPVRIAPVRGAEHAHHLRLGMKFDARLFQPLVFGENVDHVECHMRQAGVARRPVWFVVLALGIYILEDFDVRVSGAQKSRTGRRFLKSHDAVEFVVLGRMLVPIIGRNKFKTNDVPVKVDETIEVLVENDVW